MLDLLGDVFGKLTVVASLGRRPHGQYWWHCRCICGGSKDTTTGQLRGGRTRSCGCLYIGGSTGKGIPRHHLRKPGTAMRSLLAAYRCSALTRRHAFTLTESEFGNLTSGPCHYCGAPPAQLHKTRTDAYLHSGIDRQDNTRGYENDNCVSCCGACNALKGKYSAADFLVLVRRIAAHEARNTARRVQ